MRAILGRIGAHPKGLTDADRSRLQTSAVEMHRQGRRTSEIEATIEEQGATHEEARKVCAEARLQFDGEVARHVPLPASATASINYYFALGVTPRASSDRIHRAFRLRAREVHPDRHSRELNTELWGQLMTIASDAHTVLSDERTRRAYDVLWLRQSRKVTAASATPRERRGDWHTRYHWYMAEVGEIEDNLESILDDLKQRLEAGQLLDEAVMALESAADLYEDRILQIRMDALSVPAHHRALAERARLELVRKDRLIGTLRSLTEQLPMGAYSVGQRGSALAGLTATSDTRARVRDAHRRFEVDALRDAV
ncbi:MAG: J domain-containing protein [Candidatus Dormibacteria bacterium]